MARPNTTSSATTEANSSPSPMAHKSAPEAATGKRPGSRLTSDTKTDRNANPRSSEAKATQMGNASFSWEIMRALLRAAMAGRPVTEMLKSG